MTAGSRGHQRVHRRASSSCHARSSPKPQGQITTRSGADSTISSGVRGRLLAPGAPSECPPPAARTSSGVQCPPPKGGSHHSRKSTSGPGTYGFTKSTALQYRSRNCTMAACACASRPTASPTRSRSSKTCMIVAGFRFTTRGGVGISEATRCTVRRSIEHTSHRSCVRITSGRSAFSAASSSRYSPAPQLPSFSASRTCRSISALDSACVTCAVSTGRSATSVGQSHSWLRPTSSSAPPMRHSSSVAEGSRLTTRTPRC